MGEGDAGEYYGIAGPSRPDDWTPPPQRPAGPAQSQSDRSQSAQAQSAQAQSAQAQSAQAQSDQSQSGRPLAGESGYRPSPYGYSPYGQAPPGRGESAPTAGYPTPATAVVPPPTAPARPPRRGLRAPAVVAVAAVTAFVVGAVAGVGGALLVTRAPVGTVEQPPATTAPNEDDHPQPGAGPAQDAVAIAEQVLPSTVTITARGGGSGDTGSGFVIDATRGMILTNNHVVQVAADGGDLRVLFRDGRSADAEIVGRSPSYDLAVVRVEPFSGLTAVPLGSSGDAAVGESVLAVGSPLGLGGTVTQGIVSATHRPVAVGSRNDDPDAKIAYIDALQTDAAINPGNSGGPLVDATGKVIGVNSAILTLGSSTQGPSGNIGLGFAIPIDQAKVISEELITKGYATYPVLGATVADSDTTDGVRLAGVESGGPAAEAGLRGGDVIINIGQERVSSAVQLIVDIRTHRPGETVRFTYVRDSEEAEATVTLGGRKG